MTASSLSVGQVVKINKNGSEFNGQLGKILKIKQAVDKSGPRYSVAFDGDEEVTFVFHANDLELPTTAGSSTNKKKNR